MSEEPPTPEDARADAADAADEVRVTDADAWSTACAEDLEEEKARRRSAYGPPPGSAAEELRRLVDAVADKLTGLPVPLLGAVAGPAAQEAVRQAVRQAKAAVEPVIERNPDVFDHLAAAGGELLAAYRSAVRGQEHRWTTGATGNGAEDDPRDTAAPRGDGEGGADDDGEGGGTGRRVDLD
ncbi:DUF5304 domain-containing protein [Streptomyces sp. SCSIO 75703]|uniref:DUF5304 domain-containing protein n=1 Tax=unclassified Streptomyces TaxID=2593676 RepID=UPI0006B4DE88|nr:DUF5304 domain-containing protein [Streptomyces sp. TP-A0875]